MSDVSKCSGKSMLLDKCIRRIVWFVCAVVMLIVVCYSISFIPFSSKDTPGLEYKFVNVIFRHGDRTPDNNGYENFPTSLYSEMAFYPLSYGQLTNAGKRRAYILGRHIRTMYNKFLGDVYDPRTVFARSSESDRAKMTLQMVMAAIFPPAAVQKWNSTLNWQPVIMDYAPRGEDDLIFFFDCSEFRNEYQEVQRLPEIREEVEKFSGFWKNLSEWTGASVNGTTHLYFIYHGLMSFRSMGLELPEWSSGIFPDGMLLDGTAKTYEILSHNQKLRTLSGGRILKNFIDNMLAVVKGTGSSDRKMVLLSGHDINISTVLAFLGVYEPHAPEYTSAIFVDLLGNGDKYYITINYYLGIPAKRRPLKIAGCGELCPFERFIELFCDLLPAEEDMICRI